MSTDSAALMSTDLEFTCPRCTTKVAAAYYGPCATCRSELRSIFAAEAREVVSVAYEPKMNVVPNQIATKD